MTPGAETPDAVAPDPHPPGALPRRRLGETGPLVGAVGFGAMGLSGVYGPSDDAEGERVVRRALDLGVTLVDTADVYGNGHNERLVGRALRGRRDEAVLATKFGADRETGGGRPDHVRAALEASLRRLDVDVIDLWYLHRVDPTTPVAETVGAMAEAVAAGRVRWIGLSEVSAATVRAAHAVHPVTAVQSEWSLVSREVEAGALPTLRELGVSFVAYSPVSRGLLTGALRTAADVEGLDRRAARYPRFAAEHLEVNLGLADRLRALAAPLGLTPAQLALAWVVARGDDVVPVLGTRRVAHLEEGVAAASVRLEPEVLAALDAAFPPGVVAGDRYAPDLLRRVDA